MAAGRRAARRAHRRADGMPAREIRFRDVTLRVSRRRAPVLDGFDLDHSRRIVARHRRPERRRQDDARQAAVPAVRPAGRRDRDRRRRSARVRRRRRGARASPRCSRTSSASSCRCATTWRPAARPTTSCARALAAAGAADLAELDTILARGYDGGTDLSGGQWQRVALARALCAVRAGRRRRPARRADRAARRPRRGGDLRSPPRRDAALHDDPHLASLLDGAPCRSHLRARARPRRRARHARRADGARRPLPDDVRPAGAAVHRAEDEEGMTL